MVAAARRIASLGCTDGFVPIQEIWDYFDRHPERSSRSGDLEGPCVSSLLE